MRTLQEKYNAVLEGGFSKTQFRRDAAMELPQFVSNVNSFDDTVAILKNKGVVTEAKKQEPKYSTAKPADQVAPDVLDTGIKFELDKKHGTLDVTPEEYEKAREVAIKNLAKDVLYYVNQDSIQLETPAEQMEKVTLKEETDEAIQNIENDEYTVKRVAKLTNQLLQDNPEDHSVKAYAISIKNDLESGDASRLKRYKDLLSVDDLKKDMEHFISHDVDQLEEEEDLDATEKAASAKIGKGEEFTDDDAAAVADKMPKIKKDAEFKLIGEDEPDVEDLYQHDQEYLDTLKKRKALKEMFKKIIAKVLTEEVKEEAKVIKEGEMDNYDAKLPQDIEAMAEELGAYWLYNGTYDGHFLNVQGKGRDNFHGLNVAYFADEDLLSVMNPIDGENLSKERDVKKAIKIIKQHVTD